MTEVRSDPPDLPGFSLVQGIGGGGFADVFLYRQHHPNRPVAIKVLRAEHLSDESLRHFSAEADLMAQVSAHPYIVTIYSAGVAPDGRPYIVMEHYPQPHFGLRARGGRLAVAEVLRVGVQVASAVETAHRAGILHRDIKPANILTSDYGRPGLTDFGIAGVQGGDGVRAAEGMTVAFSGPEVLAGEAADGSVASDIYSLAATVYALLAGRSPVWVPGGANTDHDLLTRALNNEITPMDRPDVPASLQHLLSAGMAQDPVQRPVSALAFARALQDVEQELAFAPTALEVRDEIVDQPVVEVTPADEQDGTRRASLQVVSPAVTPLAPPPAPLASPSVTPPGQAGEHARRNGPGAPPEAQNLEGASPSSHRAAETAGPGTTVPSGVRPVDDLEETIRRPQGVGTVVPSSRPATAESIGPATGTRHRRFALIAAVAAVGVVGLGSIGFLSTGKSGSHPAESRAEVAPDPAPSLPPPALAVPTDVMVRVLKDYNGSPFVFITFQSPYTGPDVSFRIARSDGTFPDGSAWFDVPADGLIDVADGLVVGTSIDVGWPPEMLAMLDGGRRGIGMADLGIVPGEAGCFQVAAVVGSRVSDFTGPACAVMQGG